MTKRLTAEQLEAIRKRAEAALEGPWITAHTTDGQWIIEENGDIISGTVTRVDDATFIIRSREDIPALLAEVERLRAALYSTATNLTTQITPRIFEKISEIEHGRRYGMTTNKLAAAKDWRNRPLETWNVASFCAYLTDKHTHMFGIDYAPMRGWRTEQGILGGLIGTQSRTAPKPRTASNADVKRFIDETFASYTPTAQYPGTSFGFMWSYRKTDWQRIQAESNRKQRAEQHAQQEEDWDEITEWL